MDNNRIFAFLSVANWLSFTKAADELFKNQSVLSRQIASMENEIGIRLFDRGSKAIKLTPAGEVLQRGLKKHLENYYTLLEEAKAIQDGYVGNIIISAHVGQLISDLLVPLLNAFEKTNRGIAALNNSHVLRDNPMIRFLPLQQMGVTEESIIWNKENTNPCMTVFVDFARSYACSAGVSEV